MFSNTLLNWFDVHGRHHLPWQDNKNPYRVWLSEVMLQQTQVITVIPYFEKFTSTFPTLASLAAAEQDDVLALWSGLGYYSRARNIHKTAQLIQEQHEGLFPQTAEELIALPGIGRSTAHAILSIVWDKPLAILDGNVKRVLTRYYGIYGSPYQSSVEKSLWLKAQAEMPLKRAGDYTQAIMDLGATLCTRSKPSCDRCPFSNNCVANVTNSQNELPTKKPKVIKPEKDTNIYFITNSAHQIFLEKRPAKGLWGGLWSLPGSSTDMFNAPLALPDNIPVTEGLSFRHTFTHFHLDIRVLSLDAWGSLSLKEEQQWFSLDDALTLGLPSAIKKILTAALAPKTKRKSHSNN